MKSFQHEVQLEFQQFVIVHMQFFTPVKLATSPAENIPIVTVGDIPGFIPACCRRIEL